MILIFSCSSQAPPSVKDPHFIYDSDSKPDTSAAGTWQEFLRTLPLAFGPVKDYRGIEIENQSKHFQLIGYDVGKRDLQQCADFLIRLRAEYLFQMKRNTEINFKFTSGQAYSFVDHCRGIYPVISGNKLVFKKRGAVEANYRSLRNYLDIVFAYAGTISLYRDLKTTGKFETGTIIITPGSPGHCMIIVDKKLVNGQPLYRLAESYMPAQTPYILKNAKDGSPWHTLEKGKSIETSSFHFTKYELRTFE